MNNTTIDSGGNKIKWKNLCKRQIHFDKGDLNCFTKHETIFDLAEIMVRVTGK